jgi:hypothetical protein
VSHIQDFGDAPTSPYGDAASPVGDVAPKSGDAHPSHEMPHLPQEIEQLVREMRMHLQNPGYMTLLKINVEIIIYES